jgi:DNA-directed RNA polymerase subunit RPC12/RpoP
LYVAILTDDAYSVGLEDICMTDAEWQSVFLVADYQARLRIFADAFYNVRNCRLAWTDIGEYLLEIGQALNDGRLTEYLESGAINYILAKPEKAEESEEVEETYRCLLCGEIDYDYCGGCQRRNEHGLLYECTGCSKPFNQSGTKQGDAHKCPECGNPGHKAYYMGCGEYVIRENARNVDEDEQEIGEMILIQAGTCPLCGKMIDLELWEEHCKIHIKRGSC